MRKNRVMLIGWDGATFDIIDPLVAAGRLPNVATLMKNGVRGRMESTIPALTPTAWTSLSTGVNPGKHGIFDAMLFSAETKRNTFINTTMRRAKPLWTVLSERGKKVGVMNVPATYPPDEVDGFVIPGMFTPEGAGAIMHPPELQAELTEKFGPYSIECRQSNSPSVYLQSILSSEVSSKEKIASYLIDRYEWDFFFCVFTATDRVQHFFWKYLDPSHPDHGKYGDAIASVYERMDEALGRLIARAGEDTTVVMASDHGAGPLKTAFFLNLWLQQNGYLFLNQDFSSMLRRTPRIRSFLAKVRKKISGPGRIGSGVTDADRDGINRFPARIDWARTSAFSEGVGGGIFINPQVIGPDRYRDTTERIIQGLLAVRDELGNNVVKTVYRRDDLYTGAQAQHAPDLLVICETGFQVIGPNELLFFKNDYKNSMFLPHRWSGRHEQDGIFIAKGPAAEVNLEIKGCRIIDVAPTVLYLMDEAVPDTMDGKVLEASIQASFLQARPVRYSSDALTGGDETKKLSDDEGRQISDKLRDLGYLE